MGDDAVAHGATSWTRPRATSRNTSSSVVAVVAGHDIVGAVVVLDAAALHDDDAVAQPLHLQHVVRRQQDGRAMGLAIGLEMLPDPVGGIGIERCRRLVQQQQLGLVDQRFRQRHPGLLPGGEFAIGTVEEIAKIEIGGEFLDPLAQIRHRVEPAEYREILPHREPHRHIDIGAFEIHPAQHVGALLGHRTAQHLDTPRGRQHQPHDHGDGRGLAGAVAAEQPGDAAARDAERHIVDGAGGLVELDQTRDLDRRGSCRIGRGQRAASGVVSRHAGRSLGHRGGERKIVELRAACRHGGNLGAAPICGRDLARLNSLT